MHRTDADETSRTPLRAALADFARSPGKFQVGLRQPQLLFASLPEVLQIAVGREGEGAASEQESLSLRDAARFFVRSALLYPGADHYALLGLDRKAEPSDLKNRYRLMMRLLHPDFLDSAAAVAWPADSAVRVNRAYDTLSSAVERRAYDETLATVNGPPAVHSAVIRPRPVPKAADSDTKRSSFKALAVVCALASVALVAVSLMGSGSSETGQLVQRKRAQAEEGLVAIAQLSRPTPAPIAQPRDVSVAQKTVAGPAPTKAAVMPVAAPPVAPPQPSIITPVLERLAQNAKPIQVPAVIPLAANELKTEVVAPPAPTPAVAAVSPGPATASSTQGQASTPPKPPPRAGPTLVEAQPLLAQLLQVMESGRGERILNLLDADARSKPAAQALSREYDTLVDGARPVRVSHVEFKAEPGDGRLMVVGNLRVLAGEQTIGSLGKKMILRAEFASREGTVVITGLSGGPVN